MNDTSSPKNSQTVHTSREEFRQYLADHPDDPDPVRSFAQQKEGKLTPPAGFEYDEEASTHEVVYAGPNAYSDEGDGAPGAYATWQPSTGTFVVIDSLPNRQLSMMEFKAFVKAMNRLADDLEAVGGGQ